MTNKTDYKKIWAAERRGYEKIFNAVTGRKTRVLSIEPPDDKVGYTTEKGEIYLAFDNDLFEGCNDLEKATFRKGIFTHEMLHQVYTPFKYEKRVVNALQPFERGVFATIFNILEDPAIENFASKIVGGHLLTALRFAIANTYKISPNIEEAKSPFGQYMSALVQFGDMGVLKGYFTFDEAREIFLKTAPLFYKGIEEPSGKKRVNIAKEIFEISRPLWEEEAKNREAFEQMMSELLEELSKMGKSFADGSGSGEDPDGEPGEGGSSGSSKKSERRKITLKKVSKEEMEKMKKSGSSGGGELPDGDITVYYSDEDDGSGDGSGQSIDGDITKEGEDSEKGDKTNKGESSENGDKGDQADGDEGEQGEGDNKSNSENESKSKGSDSQNGDFIGHHTGKNRPNQKIEDIDANADIDLSDDKNTVGEITNEEYTLTEEDLAYIEKEAEQRLAEYESETEGESDSSSIESLDIKSPKLGHRSCLNYRMTYEGNSIESLENSYNRAMERLAPGIKSTVVQLKKIFEQDFEEKEYRTSGKVNIKRANSTRVTSRIFDRRRTPGDRSDIAVFILVDESGSMSSSQKYVAASECCIALSEVFAQLKIDTYVMGFTADTLKHDVVHNHYITWKNTHAERLKLLNIDARSNNLDGYSIRYATEILKKSKAKNKLLIVLSDGQPAAYNYTNGVADTKDAVRDAKKDVSVLGVAIGNSDTETIHYMYQNDFLHISNARDLFAGIAKKIRNIVKGWE